MNEMASYMYRPSLMNSELVVLEIDVIQSSCFSLQENGRSVPDLTASPGRVPPGPMPQGNMQHRTGVKEPVLLQGDFRKVSGISSEIFRQIEAVENDHDPSTAAALDVSSCYGYFYHYTISCHLI